MSEQCEDVSHRLECEVRKTTTACECKLSVSASRSCLLTSAYMAAPLSFK